jgi:hypothetical protein
VISSRPEREAFVSHGGSVIGGTRELDLDLVSFHAGLVYDFELAKTLFWRAGVGLSLSYARGDLNVSSETVIGERVYSRLEGSSDQDWLGGMYLETSIAWKVRQRLGVEAGLRYHWMEDYSQAAAAARAELDFDASLAAFLGITFSY